MKIVTPQQMQEFDRRAVSENGIPAETLMLNAGRGLVDCIVSLTARERLSRKIAICAGKGNNAGDAFCLATLLPQGYEVTLICLYGAGELSPAARHFFDKLQSSQAHIETTLVQSADDFLPLVSKVKGCDIIVDGLLGTGFTGDLSGTLKTAVKFINAFKKTVVSIDIPSGLHAETGRPSPIAVVADLTVTMGLPKTGMFLNEGPDHCGKIAV
ncbi:MAG TPA: NAD(P)H-hydrate epimerase, partial [bacterium]|nr:NAD(P)H-hydrate epimerase [bacterium]